LFISNLSVLSGIYSIYNTAGMSLQSGSFIPNGITTISTANLTSGVYILKASSDNEKSVQRILIQ